MAAKYPVAIKPGIMPMMPLATSYPATRNDLWFHDTTNAATASGIAPMPSSGTSPVRSTTPLIVLAKTKASVAAASPTANTDFEFVLIPHIRLELF
jgi:hypothetical protein